MELVRAPRRDEVELFRAKLWKDVRSLELLSLPNGAGYGLHKTSVAFREKHLETIILEELANTPGLNVPAILRQEESGLLLSYEPGIRLFNLIVELDRLPDHLLGPGAEAKRLLIARAETNQKAIQGVLYRLRTDLAHAPYPMYDKTFEVFGLLSRVLGISFPSDLLLTELRILEELWQAAVCVPFRDATSKNMLVADERLWLRNFDGEGERTRFVVDCFEKSAPGVPDWVSAPLVDYDFGSCEDLTTPEDDPISLLCHQRTWRNAVVDPSRLLWMEDCAPSPERCAVSFLVRYGRFGGRKAAYRLLHPSAHRVRFRHDDDRFYFSRLPAIIRNLSPQLASKVPIQLELLEAIASRLSWVQPTVDYFLEYGLGASDGYYVDVYPE